MSGPRQMRVRPTCGECGKPVEEFTEEEGEGSLRGFVMFVARCHGEVERQKVPRGMVNGLNFGLAFRTDVPRLAAPDQDTKGDHFKSNTNWFLLDGPRIIRR